MRFLYPLRATGQPVGGGIPPSIDPQQPQIAPTGDAPGTDSPDNGDGGNGGERLAVTPAMQAIIDKAVTTRLERERAKFAKEQEKAAKEAELAQLAANGEWQAAAQKHQARVLELEPIATERDTLAEENKALQKALTGYRDQLVANIPPETKSLLLKMPLTEQMAWLNENAAKFGATPPPKFPHTPNAAPAALTPAEMRQQKHFTARF